LGWRYEGLREQAKDIQKNDKMKEVVSILRRHLPELQERFGVKTMGLFGSFVHGEERPSSDIDILAEFERERAPTLFEFVRLQRQLSRIVGKKVDLVMKSALKPAIGKRILEETVYL
jgi:predicted nucleotidyltransferase